MSDCWSAPTGLRSPQKTYSEFSEPWPHDHLMVDRRRDIVSAPTVPTPPPGQVSGERAAGPLAPSVGASCRLRPVPISSASITGGLWAARCQVNREVAIAAGRERLESAGNLDNLRIAAGERTGDARGPVFMDSDVYKWLEAAAWEYA